MLDAIIYTDGSYNSILNRFGAGFVVIDLYDNILHTEYHGGIDDIGMRSISGEIIAVLNALHFCKRFKFENILICYDYKGIEKWCTGEWKARKSFAKRLKKEFKYYSNFMNIEFEYVKSHNGNKYNDMADELAKIGSGIIEVENGKKK